MSDAGTKTVNANAKWYIVHTYSNFEKKVAEEIKRQATIQGLEEEIVDVVVPTEEVLEVRREMSKVTWPSWKETWLTSVMVFIMVGLTMVFFFAVDWLLALGERLLIGAVS